METRYFSVKNWKKWKIGQFCSAKFELDYRKTDVNMLKCAENNGEYDGAVGFFISCVIEWKY